MRFASIFSHRKTIGLVLLAISVVAAVTYGVVTYQTPYGCGRRRRRYRTRDLLASPSQTMHLHLLHWDRWRKRPADSSCTCAGEKIESLCLTNRARAYSSMTMSVCCEISPA